MKTPALLLSLCLSTSAMATSLSSDKSEALKKVPLTAQPTEYVRVVPGKIINFEGFPAERKKLDEAILIAEEVINSGEFKNQVIAYKGSGPLGGYTGNNNLTNTQIYNVIMSGVELIGGENSTEELNFDMRRYYNRFSKVIARTFPGKHNVIEVNGKFYSTMSVASIAGNIVHEWLHLAGFYHQSARDSESVPYKVGSIAGELARKYKKQGYLD